MLLIFLSCVWVAGIFLGSRLDLPLVLILTGLIPLPLLCFTSRYRKPVILVSLGIIAFLAAAAYSFSSLHTIDESLLHFYNDSGVIELKGAVAGDPDVRDKNTRITLSVTGIKRDSGWREVEGQALIFLSRYPAYEYGDVLKVTGELETPPQLNDFDYRGYLAHQGIYTTMLYPEIEVLETGQGFMPLAWVYSLRNSLAQNLAEVVPEPQASLAQGIILGIRGNIPQELRSDFARSGTAHLLAISGLHLGIMAGVLLSVGLWFFGRRHYLYIWLALGVIWLYVLITGMHLPVVRGAIMASLFLLAEVLGRQRSAIVALAFAAAVMVGVSPYILGDASFQLSFLAMAGLVFLFPIFRNLGRRLTAVVFGEDGNLTSAANVVVDTLSATLGAVIAVWPVVAYYFGIVSLVGPLATFLALPALPAIIVIGAITGLLGFAVMAVAQVTGWLVWLFLSYMILVVSGLAAPSITAIETGTVNPAFVWAYYFVLTAALLIHKNRNRLRTLVPGTSARIKSGINVSFTPSRTMKWIILPLLVVAILVSCTAFTMPDDELRVSFLDVGEGDAILISKGSQQVLVDGGPSPQAINLELGDRMPFWDRTIELLVLTHPHHDHLAGLVEVLRRYRVEQVLYPDLDYQLPLHDEWQGLIEEKGIENTVARAGQQINLGDGVVITVLSPSEALMTGTESDIDNNSVVLRLSIGDVSFLLTGDIMRETEWELIRQGADLTSTVLKVAHHGSDTSTTQEFLAVVSPQVAVICCGSDNRFGHPDADVLSRLEKVIDLDDIYCTAEHGTIEFITDGKRLWVEVKR